MSNRDPQPSQGIFWTWGHFKLIIDDQVFALFCYVGTPTTAKVLPLIEEAPVCCAPQEAARLV